VSFPSALHERGRRHQVGALIERLQREVPEDAPLVVAGDFNDWRVPLASASPRSWASREALPTVGQARTKLSERFSGCA
jgi:endonuclease/exonuclease/phosphatase family metal-dependent hydrolase